MKPRNMLFIMSDEHNPKVMGCNGHPIVQTPNIDALAAAGTSFTSAYTTCPVCVPARAAFAVGKYVHQIGYWDNADAYEGAISNGAGDRELQIMLRIKLGRVLVEEVNRIDEAYGDRNLMCTCPPMDTY